MEEGWCFGSYGWWWAGVQVIPPLDKDELRASMYVTCNLCWKSLDFLVQLELYHKKPYSVPLYSISSTLRTRSWLSGRKRAAGQAKRNGMWLRKTHPTTQVKHVIWVQRKEGSIRGGESFHFILSFPPPPLSFEFVIPYSKFLLFTGNSHFHFSP